MANVLQESKRGKPLPRLMGGLVTTSQQYAESTTEDRLLHRMPPLLYALDVHGQFGSGGDYLVQFTEDEMIRLTSEWMALMNRRRIDAENAKRKSAEQEARSHAA